MGNELVLAQHVAHAGIYTEGSPGCVPVCDLLKGNNLELASASPSLIRLVVEIVALRTHVLYSYKLRRWMAPRKNIDVRQVIHALTKYTE